jgi:hypothetical protein
MYHEQRIINGVLHWRGVLNGEWIKSSGQIADVINSMLGMNDSDRMTIFRMFCTHCGSVNAPGETPCQCWNDE